VGRVRYGFGRSSQVSLTKKTIGSRIGFRSIRFRSGRVSSRILSGFFGSWVISGRVSFLLAQVISGFGSGSGRVSGHLISVVSGFRLFRVGPGQVGFLICRDLFRIGLDFGSLDFKTFFRN
jgi:hypothetical protein